MLMAPHRGWLAQLSRSWFAFLSRLMRSAARCAAWFDLIEFVMLEIDASVGEGGGQIIRSALTLSLGTGRSFRLDNIRARRKRPGLLRQHLTAVRAASAIGGARSHGAELNSRELIFTPGNVSPGNYRFAVGSAGSVTLVLQTVLPVLLCADGPSSLCLEGGTHNPLAPPFEFIERSFLPLLNRMGPQCTATLDRPGYFPAGGGKMRATVQPSAGLARLELTERGAIREVRATAVVSRLPSHIAERELKVVARDLSIASDRLESIEETRSLGPGNVLTIEIEAENVTEVITGFGRRGVPAETVAHRAALEAAAYLSADAPVGVHLADQLLIPLALGSGGRYVTQRLTSHTTTNIEVIRKFLDVEITATEQSGLVLIEVGECA